VMLAPWWAHDRRDTHGVLHSIDAALRYDEATERLAMRMDPLWFFRPDADKQLGLMTALECHLLIIHGGRSNLVTRDDAERLASHAGAGTLSKQVWQDSEAAGVCLSVHPSFAFNGGAV
jgi:hypothetical protein